MHFPLDKFCLIVIAVVLLRSAKGLKYYCVPDDLKCVIEDWNPTVDGYGLFQHIPNVTKSVHLINLQSLHFASKICNTIPRFIESLFITDSPQLKLVYITTTCNISVVTFISNTDMCIINMFPNDSLKSVIIKNSPLTVVPSTLQNLPNIEHLTLENSDVEQIQLSLFDPFQHLKEVSIAHGNLSVISGTNAIIGQCPLDSLKLDHNSLYIINLNVFAPFALLTMLNLAYNRIEVLTGRLSNPILATLLLNNNRLKVLDLCPWDVLHNLNTFTIAYNNIQRMPLCLNRFRNVTHVSMHFNQINSIEVEQLIQLSNLVSINLSYNNIASISTDRGSYPMKLKQLALCGNPISNDTIPGGTIGNLDVLL